MATDLPYFMALGALIGCFLVVGAYNLQLAAFNRFGIVSGR